MSSFRPGLRTPHPGLDSAKMSVTQPVAHSLHGESGWQLPGAFALNWEGWISEWYRVFNLKTFQNFSMTFSLKFYCKCNNHTISQNSLLIDISKLTLQIFTDILPCVGH